MMNIDHATGQPSEAAHDLFIETIDHEDRGHI